MCVVVPASLVIPNTPHIPFRLSFSLLLLLSCVCIHVWLSPHRWSYTTHHTPLSHVFFSSSFSSFSFHNHQCPLAQARTHSLKIPSTDATTYHTWQAPPSPRKRPPPSPRPSAPSGASRVFLLLLMDMVYVLVVVDLHGHWGPMGSCEPSHP